MFLVMSKGIIYRRILAGAVIGDRRAVLFEAEGSLIVASINWVSPMMKYRLILTVMGGILRRKRLYASSKVRREDVGDRAMTGAKIFLAAFDMSPAAAAVKIGRY